MIADTEGSVDGNAVHRFCQENGARAPGSLEVAPDVSIRMTSKQHPLWHFVDDEDEVELYVVFSAGVRGLPWDGASTSKKEEYAYKVMTIYIHVQIIGII